MSFFLKNLTLHLGTKILCQDFTLTIQPGEIWCILGKNGVGKTSFLQSLCGIKKLSAGNIFFNDIHLLTTSARNRAKIVGLLLQEQEYVFPAAIKDIVLAGRHPHDKKILGETNSDFEIVSSILQQLDLTTLAERNITELSGGERRRAAIGTLLAQMPEIYLLDEPTNHLDIHYQIKILDLFKNIAHQQQKIIIMVTHDLNLAAKYANKIMLHFDGGIIISGDKKELLTATQLTKLYNHSIQQVVNEGCEYFFV